MNTFIYYIETLIDTLQRDNRQATARRYSTTLSSFCRYLTTSNTPSPKPSQITSSLIQSYEAYMLQQGLCPNTTSYYMRNLRALYNRAVDDRLTPQRHPFKRVYTGISATVKRAIAIETIGKIATLDLHDYPALDYARDMFMLAFYLRGMSLIDIAQLTPSSLHEDYLTYRRHKTGQTLTIRWTAEMQTILDKYPANPAGYLFPIITNPSKDPIKAYRNASCRINRNLHKIALLIGLPPHSLTHYVARHSWATAALNVGIPVSIISQAMGHENETTTRIYLASLDTTPVDEANDLILSRLHGRTEGDDYASM